MQDVTITVDPDDESPVLTARTRTEATIWGGHGTWPLQLEIHYTPTVGAGWRRTRSPRRGDDTMT